MNAKYIQLLIGVVVLLFLITLGARYLDSGEQMPANPYSEPGQGMEDDTTSSQDAGKGNQAAQKTPTTPNDRPVSTGDSSNPFEEIPDSEILSGGPGKDGIPSIDDPKFVSVKKASFLNSEDIGIALQVGDEARFYPFQILVWHEIVNDTVEGVPLAITYCPLCFTGITYERNLDGKVVEFGVSGMLWKSNLIMYDRTANVDNESLWSQILGRAIKGPKTGTKLTIYPSDIIKFGEWSRAHPDGLVLSRDTGVFRLYGTDPYGGYYTNRDVLFDASFSDTRLHPKEFVLGIEVDGQFKAYVSEALPVGTTIDTFAGKSIVIEKSEASEVRFFANEEPVSQIGSFWFAWLEAHPTTELYEG